jgi:transposase
VEAGDLAGAKKKAIAERRVIVFVDESGLSERPARLRTWAPKGCTPQLEFHFNWNKLSMIAGVSAWNVWFRLVPGTVGRHEVVDFLRQLRRQIRRKLLVIWDGLAAHRSRTVREYVATTRGTIHLSRLPAYAPELNPCEYLWAHLKTHELGNFCPVDFRELTHAARRKLGRCKRRPTLIRAFWKQAELDL